MFQFTPVVRRATFTRATVAQSCAFQFTPVVRRATYCSGSITSTSAFQFTPVVRRATFYQCRDIDSDKFQFTPVVRRATASQTTTNRRNECFNSRPSCDGRPAAPEIPASRTRFNSRPSCDGRPGLPRPELHHLGVSIHARRATGDLRKVYKIGPFARFQFTPVVRRATWRSSSSIMPFSFNSRPSCDGRLARTDVRTRRSSCFNSRPSCDGRHEPSACRVVAAVFQFTPVVRRATIWLSFPPSFRVFQFTPVVRRATPTAAEKRETARFNSRPSCDGRLEQMVKAAAAEQFQFTPVVRRATTNGEAWVYWQTFQFTPVVRRATGSASSSPRRSTVSIHARRATGDLFADRAGRPLLVSIHARRATGDHMGKRARRVEQVSIHARRATGDSA